MITSGESREVLRTKREERQGLEPLTDGEFPKNMREEEFTRMHLRTQIINENEIPPGAG